MGHPGHHNRIKQYKQTAVCCMTVESRWMKKQYKCSDKISTEDTENVERIFVQLAVCV